MSYRYFFTRRSYRSIAAILLVILSFLLSSVAFGSENSGSGNCDLALNKSTTEERRTRSLSEITSLHFATFNVENLFYHTGKREAVSPGVFVQKSLQKDKSPRALAGVARAIREMNLDMAVLQEVESMESAQRFVDDYLGGDYEAHLIPGNDARGINVAFITKRDLPLSYLFETHKDEKWEDPTMPNAGPQPLFSRDVPVMKAYATVDNRQLHLVSIAGVHNKSKRDRPGDPEGVLYRGNQVKREVEIWKDLRNEMGKNARVILAGDFNADLKKDPELQPLLSLDSVEALNALGQNQDPMSHVTHSFHPKDQPTEYSEIDYIFLTPALANRVKQSFVYRYKDDQGVPWPLPRTSGQRAKNPSDHFPKYVEFDFQEILADSKR